MSWSPTLLLMGLATTGIGLLPTYGHIGIAAPILLTLLRFVQGFAAGGEKTGALILLFENAPPKRRGLLTSLPAIGTGTGTLLSTGAFAVITGLVSEDAFLSWGWRIPFLFSAALTFFGLWVRRALPESPGFQRESVPQAPAPTRSRRRRIAESRCVTAWRRYPKEMLIVIGAGAAENAGYYVYGTFSITYADDRGLATAGLLSGITAISALKLITVPAFGALSDRVGRRPVSLMGAALLLASAWPFFQIVDTGQTWAIWAALLITLGLGQSAILGSQPAFFAELFDASVRFSAVGIANNIGTVLTGGLAPMLCSALLLWFDHSITGIVIFIALMSAMTIVTVGLARETRHSLSTVDATPTAPGTCSRQADNGPLNGTPADALPVLRPAEALKARVFITRRSPEVQAAGRPVVRRPRPYESQAGGLVAHQSARTATITRGPL